MLNFHETRDGSRLAPRGRTDVKRTRTIAVVPLTLVVLAGCERVPDWERSLEDQAISTEMIMLVVKNAVAQREEVESVEIAAELRLRVKLKGQKVIRDCSFHSLFSRLADRAPERLEQVTDAVDVCLSESLLVSHLDLDQVRPLVRPVTLLERMVEQAEDPPVLERVDGLDSFAVTYVLDRPDSIAYLLQSQIDAAGIEQPALKAIAMQNLRSVAERLLTRQGEPPLYRLVLDGWYDESLILLSDLWEGERPGVAGDPVVAMPTRGVLLYTGTLEEDGLARLRAVVAEYGRDEATVLSRHLLHRRQGRWIELQEEEASNTAPAPGG